MITNVAVPKPTEKVLPSEYTKALIAEWIVFHEERIKHLKALMVNYK